MTKNSMLFIFIFGINLAYAETDLNKKIVRLTKESSKMSKELILSEVLKLREDAMSENIKIIDGDKYRVDDVVYLADLDTVLDAVPLKVEEFSTCEKLKITIASSFQTSWKDAPAPALDLWPLLQKICK